jgi:hypothetical protein
MTLKVNGRVHTVDIDPATLLYVLSDDGVTTSCAEQTDNSRKDPKVGGRCDFSEDPHLCSTREYSVATRIGLALATVT